MPTRFVSLPLLAILIHILASIMTCGHDFIKGPLKDGCKKRMVRAMYRFIVSLYLWIAGMWSSKVEKDCDYSYYLGPDYKQGYR